MANRWVLTRVQWHFHGHHAPQCQVQLAVRDPHGYRDLAEAWPSLSTKWAAGMASWVKNWLTPGHWCHCSSTILLNRLGMLGIKNYKKPFCLYQNHVRSGHPMAPSMPNPNLANEDWPRRSGMESPASQKMGNYGWSYLGKFLHKLKGGNSIKIHKIPKAVLVGCCSCFNLPSTWHGMKRRCQELIHVVIC